MPRRPVILSASRRTDLPGWFPEVLAARLGEHLETKGDTGIYGTVFWTRFPIALMADPLRGLIEGALRSVAVNLTVTGLGGSRLEPLAPQTDEVLAVLPDLIALLGDPARIRWRFDPLIPRADGLRDFARLAERMAALGVPTCTFAFPSPRSLRGNLVSRYGRLGVPQWPSGGEARQRFVRDMVAIAAPLGVQLLCCSQPGVLAYDPAVQPAQCIPLEVLARAYPEGPLGGAPVLGGKDKTQRRHCQCPPSTDVGDYRTDVCRTGCLYCYSTLGGPDAGETVPWFLHGKGWPS